MRIADLMRFALAALSGHRLRSALCLTGVAVGVAAVIVLTALGEGARRYVTGEFESLGSDLLIVLPGRSETTGGGAAPVIGGAPHDLTLADAEAVRRQLPRVRTVAPLTMATGGVAWQGRRRDVPVIGTTTEFLAVRGLRIATGRFLPASEWRRGDRVVVLGRTVQRELFGERNPLGEAIRIDNWRFRVVGVLERRGQSLGMNLDDLVVIPVATHMRVFNRPSLFRVMARARTFDEIDRARDDIRALLTARHGDEEDITVITQDAVLSSFGRLLTILTVGLGGIAAISLAVAGLGVMNVMLVAVAERTSEVGLLRALGVSRGQVAAMFLAEAAGLTAAGGVVGLGAGMLLVRLVRALFPALPAAPPGWAIAAVLVLGTVVGLLSGAWPARRAARLDPITSLTQGRGA